MKNKLNDLRINWQQYEGSKDTVLAEFEVKDKALDGKSIHITIYFYSTEL